MTSFTLPPDHPRIRQVNSFQELVTTPWANGVNALCWPRMLPGDFGEVAARLRLGPGITTLEEEMLAELPVSPAGRLAIEAMLADLSLLRDHGLDPALNGIDGYPRDEHAGPVPTDVFSYHADSAPVPADTWLCTYHGASSEVLGNEEVRRCVDIPETRAELFREFGGAEGPDFEEFLHEHCYDLHYVPVAGAQPFAFGLGNLWRISLEYPGCPVPPCVHRAPLTHAGDPPRLLLIS